MKASFGKKIAVLCLSAAMAIGVGFGISGIKTAKAATEYKDIVAESYKLNSIVKVTDEEVAENEVKFPKTYDVNGDGQLIATAYVITYPDGVALSIKDSVQLDQLGKYEIAYRAYNNNVATVYYDTFNVHNNFSNNASFVTLHEKDVYSAYKKIDKGTTYKASEIYSHEPAEGAVVEKTVKGVRVALESGVSVTLNNIIDASTKYADEEGFVNLATVNLGSVERSATNLKQATLINKNFDIIFTDVNDPNNYIKITSSNQVGSIGHSFGVETAHTPLIGTADTYVDNAVEKEGSVRIFYVDGVRNAAFINQTRTWGNGEDDYYDYSFLYNPTTKVVKMQAIRHFNFEYGNKNVISQDVIIDLDNPDIFDEGAQLFEGFSTGEVKITLQARNFELNTAHIDVLALAGITGEELQEYYKADTIVDSIAPVIKVNAKSTDVNGVYSAYDPVHNVKFFVPDAVAYDANKCSEVEYRVYKNYVDKDSAKVLVDVNDDGSFYLSEKVIYTIEYRASDIYGNEGIATFNVVPVEASELSVTGDVVINEGIKAVFDKLTLVAGVDVSVDALKYLDTLNVKEDLNVKLTITKGGKEYFNANYNLYNYEGQKIAFKPIETGKYTVTYEFTDNANYHVESYEVNCVSNNVVEFASAPLLQKYYILGMTYEKPDFTAYKFGDTMVENKTDVYLSYDEGATWVKAGNTFVMGADSEGNLIPNVDSVMFKYVSQGVEDYVTGLAEIVDVRNDAAIANNEKIVLTTVKNKQTANIDQAKYFDVENAELKSNLAELYMAPVDNATSMSATFINPLGFNTVGQFYINLKTQVGMSDFNSLTITLTDIYDENNSVYFQLFMLGDDTRCTLNGGKAFASPVALKENSNLQFYYSVANQLVTIGGKNYDLPFKPAADRFYITLSVDGITSERAALSILTFGNHKFNMSKQQDTSAPMIYYTSAAGSYALNSLVTIYSPNVNDILTPYTHRDEDGNNRTKMTVKLNNAPIKSKDGVLLDGTQDPTKNYVIELDKYATWKVEYTVVDAAGKSTAPSFQISATDTVAPEITLNYGFNESTVHNVTLGKAFSIEYTVSDDVSEQTKISVGVVIINDSNYFTVYSSEPFEIIDSGDEHVPITDSCIITRRGMYTVYVMAIDEAKNMTIVSYKLNVQ